MEKKTEGNVLLEKNMERIYCRVAGRKRMGKRIEAMPTEHHLDMIVYYYLRLDISREEYLSVAVTNSNLESWGMTKRALKKLAWANTMRDQPAIFQPLDEILINEETQPLNSDKKLFLLSNAVKNLGAVCIFYPDFLKRVGEKINSDFYLLPSSIHECLILKKEADLKVSSLREMVRTINRTELQEQDILTDSVYLYSREEEKLMIDNS